MIVYADLIFLLNGVIDYFLLWLTAALRYIRFSPLRTIMAAILGGLYTIIPLLGYISFSYSLLGKILVSLLMILLAFDFLTWKNYLANILLFYLLCLLSGGTLLALHYALADELTDNMDIFRIPLEIWLIGIIAIPAIGWYIRFSILRLRDIKQLHTWLLPIRVTINQHTIECKGLLDTGNRLRDPISQRPVIIMEYNLWRHKLPSDDLLFEIIHMDKVDKLTKLPFIAKRNKKWRTKIGLLPYRTAGHDKDWMVTIVPDAVSLHKEGRWYNIPGMLIGIDGSQLTPDGLYKAILPSCVIEAKNQFFA